MQLLYIKYWAIISHVSICIINIIMIKIVVHKSPELDFDNILKYIGLLK